MTNIAGVSVTVLEGETHGRSSQMTEQVVETGRIISDHIILKPRKITLQFEQSNTPMTGESGPDAVRRVFGEMEQLWSGRMPNTLVTAHTTYLNMVLIELSSMHKAPFKWTLKFSATFQQANEANTTFSAIPLKQMVNKSQFLAFKSGTLGTKVLPPYGYDTPFVSWLKANSPGDAPAKQGNNGTAVMFQ